MNKFIILHILLFFNLAFSDNLGSVAIVTANPGLNLRVGPDLKSKIILMIPLNQKVSVIEKTEIKETIYGKTSNWWKVSFNGKEGYAFGGFLHSESVYQKEKEVVKYKLEVLNNNKIPSILYLTSDGKFTYHVNLCNMMGNLYGDYKILYSEEFKKKIISAKITNSDFEITEEKKADLIFIMEEEDKLIYFTKNPLWVFGCDFYQNNQYYKLK